MMAATCATSSPVATRRRDGLGLLGGQGSKQADGSPRRGTLMAAAGSSGAAGSTKPTTGRSRVGVRTAPVRSGDRAS
jgi:hypothetical protein